MDCFVGESAGSFSAGPVDVFRHFTAGGIGLAETGKNFVGAGIEMLRDKALQFLHKTLDLFGGGIAIPLSTDLSEDLHHLAVQVTGLLIGPAFRFLFIFPLFRGGAPFGFGPAGILFQF